MLIARKYLIKGRVQGVFFRTTAALKAEELGISGSAVNLPNGDVQIIASGEEESMQAFFEWLHDGPRQASVTSVSCETYAGELPQGFTIRY